MTLTNYFSAIVYESISGTQMQSEQLTLERLLFPIPPIISTRDADRFVISENGHFRYRNKVGFGKDMFVAYSQTEAKEAWEVWRKKKNADITRHYAKKELKIPALFGDYFELEKITPIFPPQDTSEGLPPLQDKQRPQYYELSFRITLPSLNPEPFGNAWEDYRQELAQNNAESLIPFADNFVHNFLDTNLKKLISPYTKGVLEGEGMKVLMGMNRHIIGIDYFHTPLTGKKAYSELYQPYDFPTPEQMPTNRQQNELMQPSAEYQNANTSANARTSSPDSLSSAAPIMQSNVQNTPSAKLTNTVMKRTESGLVAPLWMGLQGSMAACREAISVGKGKKPDPNVAEGVILDANNSSIKVAKIIISEDLYDLTFSLSDKKKTIDAGTLKILQALAATKGGREHLWKLCTKNNARKRYKFCLRQELGAQYIINKGKDKDVRPYIFYLINAETTHYTSYNGIDMVYEINIYEGSLRYSQSTEGNFELYTQKGRKPELSDEEIKEGYVFLYGWRFVSGNYGKWESKTYKEIYGLEEKTKEQRRTDDKTNYTGETLRKKRVLSKVQYAKYEVEYKNQQPDVYLATTAFHESELHAFRELDYEYHEEFVPDEYNFITENYARITQKVEAELGVEQK